MNRKAIANFVLVVLFLVSVMPAPSKPSSTHYSSSTFIDPPATQWNMTYGGAGDDTAYSVRQTIDEGYIVAGYTTSFGEGSADVWLVKTDVNGHMLWNQTFGGGGNDVAHSVRQTTDGGYIAAGYTTSFGEGSADFYLIKTDANGNMIWSKTYGGNGTDVAESVQQATDGGYLVAGYTTSFGGGSYDFWLIKVDTNGNSIWSQTYGGGDRDLAYSVWETTDGGYMIAGHTKSFGEGLADFWLVKTDVNGGMVWNQTYGGAGNDLAGSAQQTTDGGYILSGCTNSFGAGSGDVWLVKTDVGGHMVWNRYYGGSDFSTTCCVKQTTDGGYIVAAITNSFGNDNGTSDFWLFKTDGDGNMIWNQTYGGVENDEALCVQQTTDGGYVVAGYTASFGNDNGTSDFWLIKIAPEQRELDVNTFHEGNTGAFPRDADPAICYDTASAELLMNTMQGLLSWNGEQHSDFVPTLATNIPARQDTTMIVTNTSKVGADPTDSTWTDGGSTFSCVGWVDEKQNGFDNGDIVYMTDGTHWHTWTADTVTNTSTVTMSLWRGSYVFNIRTADSHGNPIQFYGSDGNAVDTFDVMDAAYSFRWAQVLDVPGQPVWMFDKPFFDQFDHTYWTSATAMDLAHLINDAIVPDNVSNTLTLNVGCRFPDNAFKQILSSTWGAILSEEHSIALGGWDGNLFTTTKYGGPFPDWWIDWAGEGAGIDYVNLDPLNKVEAATYAGTGPYHVALVDQANSKVILQKNPSFWQGWPAPGCNGSIDTIEIDYIADWTTRKNEFLAGTIDTCTVPRFNMFELLDNTTKEPVSPQIKTIKNISPYQLRYDAFLFEFNISDESPYVGTGQFPDGIPLDFFNNTHVRRAFAYSFNWSTYGEQAFYGEYDYRKNWLIEGLYPDYYNDSIPGYYESLSSAEAELKAAIIDGQNVWNSGFNFTVGYNPGDDPARIAFTMISDFFKRLSTYDGRNGPSFTVNVQAIPRTLRDFRNRLRPICVIGWLADCADADDFARSHMYSEGIFGDFAKYQGYTAENGWGSTKDVLVDQAVLTADDPVREAIYYELQKIYYDDAPSFPLPASRVRRWQQYWVKGWYCNPMYYGLTYFYSVWKSDDCWFDVSGPSRGVSDGVVNMRDIAYLVDHFNAKAPIAGQAIDPKWVGVYGANGCVDPSGDRVCNLRDIAGCILHFNHKMNTDTP